MNTNSHKTALFMFTVRFPYGRGEQFIVDELKRLAGSFDHVFIQPMFGVAGQRTLPLNCTVYRPLWAGSARKLSFYLRSLVSLGSWRRFLPETVRAARAGNVHPAVFAKIFMWAAYSAALERSKAVADAIAWNHGPRVAYSYWGHTPALARRALHRAGVPVAIRYHRTDLYIDSDSSSRRWTRNASYMPWHHDASRESRALIFISAHGSQYFKDNWAAAGEGGASLHVSRLGTEDHGVNPPGRSKELVLVSCSRVSTVKQVEKVAALVQNLGELRAVRWHHFGGSPDDLPEVEIAVSRLREIGIPVSFHGYVENDKLIKFYSKTHVDLFVNLSSSEGVPVSTMEAISFGIPALSTDVGGSSEVVVSGESGLLVSPADADASRALAARVLDALKPDGAIERSDPRDFWRRRFSADKNYAELTSLLLELAG